MNLWIKSLGLSSEEAPADSGLSPSISIDNAFLPIRRESPCGLVMSKSRASRARRDEPSVPRIWDAAAMNDAMSCPESETNFGLEPLAESARGHARPTGSIVPLAHDARPPRSGAAESELARAIFVCQAQEKFLQKAREALDRMLELAILAQQSVSDERNACLEEFDTLVAFLEKLADTEIEGVKLFKSPNLIVRLPEQSDTLVLPGVDLNHESFRAALRTNVSDPVSAGAALGTVQKAVRWLVLSGALVSTNLQRLAFLDQRTEDIKQVNFPTLSKS